MSIINVIKSILISHHLSHYFLYQQCMFRYLDKVFTCNSILVSQKWDVMFTCVKHNVHIVMLDISFYIYTVYFFSNFLKMANNIKLFRIVSDFHAVL